MSNELIAIIGGTGLTEYDGLDVIKKQDVKTSLGALASPLVFGTLHGKNVVFLARHGQPHAVAPHKVNYTCVKRSRCKSDCCCECSGRNYK